MSEAHPFPFVDSLDCFATGAPVAMLDTDFDRPLFVAKEGETRQLPETFKGYVPDNCPLLVAPDAVTPRTIATFAVCLECPKAAEIEIGGMVTFPGRK